MNGVVNVVTKRAADTQGGLVDAKAGNFLQRAAARWGGSIEGGGSYRFYAVGFAQGDTTIAATGANAMDSWHGAQAGLRADVPLAGRLLHAHR
jgi:iron complex outermembrane receptor protein